jgi:hypothetical protein
MPQQEAFKFLAGRSPDVPTDPSQFEETWKRAKNAVEQGPPANLDAEPEVLPPESEPHLARLKEQVHFKEAVGQYKAWSIQSLLIDRLLSIQRYIDEAYALESVGNISGSETAKALEIALPIERTPKNVMSQIDPVAKSISVFSHNIDLRVHGPAQGQDPNTKRLTFGFQVGWGTPMITVAHLSGRYILKNGYHRVLGLRKRGFERVPALVFEATRLEDTGANRPGFAGTELLTSAHPPNMADFYAEGVSVSLNLRPVTKVLRITAEEFLLPVEITQPPPPAPSNGSPLEDGERKRFQG